MKIILKKFKFPELFSRATIVFYHNLRNELYHAGNGMMPEKIHLKGIRDAAIWIFSTLYDVNGEELLKKLMPPPKPVSIEQIEKISPHTRFLQYFIKLEGVINEKLEPLASINIHREYAPFSRKIEILKTFYKMSNEDIRHLNYFNAIRNQIVHALEPEIFNNNSAPLITRVVIVGIPLIIPFLIEDFDRSLL